MSHLAVSVHSFRRLHWLHAASDMQSGCRIVSGAGPHLMEIMVVRRTQRWSGLAQTIGPGIMYAGAAIGVVTAPGFAAPKVWDVAGIAFLVMRSGKG